MRIETIGNATLYQGDCLEIFPTLKIECVVTDPPYGIGESWGSSTSWQKHCGKARMWGSRPDWDVAPEAHVFEMICKYPSIIWGGNYFTLPPSKGWLVWDKCAEMTQAQAELAWSNIAPNVRIFRKSPLGVWGNGGANGEVKEHPTQKPLVLMEWCINFLGNAGVVSDPFMGTGTTGVACANVGKRFIGIEREPKYFDIACRRIDAAHAQGRLFV